MSNLFNWIRIEMEKEKKKVLTLNDFGGWRRRRRIKKLPHIRWDNLRNVLVCWSVVGAWVINHDDDTIAQRPPSKQKKEKRYQSFLRLWKQRQAQENVLCHLKYQHNSLSSFQPLMNYPFDGAKVSFHFFFLSSVFFLFSVRFGHGRMKKRRFLPQIAL